MAQLGWSQTQINPFASTYDPHGVYELANHASQKPFEFCTLDNS